MDGGLDGFFLGAPFDAVSHLDDVAVVCWRSNKKLIVMLIDDD